MSDLLMRELRDWAEQGWLRHLDCALAAFVRELDPQAAPALLLASALLAHCEGRGHSCLPLDACLADAESLLAWPAPALARLAQACTELGMDGGATAWAATLRASPSVGHDGDEGRSPLVLAGHKLYLRRYRHYEVTVAAQVRARAAAAVAVDEAALQQGLARLFPASADGSTDWQRRACEAAARARLTLITGGPGTGKTYTAARLLALLSTLHGSTPLRIALAAPTGKAAARLKQSIDQALAQLPPAASRQDLAARIGPARTLHALLGARPGTRRFVHGPAHPLPLDLLIVDEASMVHLEMMAALLAALASTACVVFLGDKDQLASVEAGAVLGDLCRDADGTDALARQTVTLRHSRRFEGAIGRLAAAVNAGDASAATALLQPGRDPALRWLRGGGAQAVVHLALHGRDGAPGGYSAYLDLLRQRPAAGDAAAWDTWVRAVLTAFDRLRVLCALRDGEWGARGMNAAIERALGQAGLIARGSEWYEGRPVMVTRNDPGLGVFNGDIGIALRPDGGALRVHFAVAEGWRAVGVGRLADVETAYAMTVHKSQGSEFDHAVLVLPEQPSRLLTRELVYTGLTRARSAFTLAGARPQALAEALAQRTWRASGLPELLSTAAPC
jgi:exodeoxyribonuclease V alpha subunit